MIGERMQFDGARLAAVLSFLFLAGGLGGGLWMLRKTPEPQTSKPALKHLDREMMSGASISSPQWGDFPRIQFDSVRVVKPRFGGISLGGFNRLEVDNLRLVLVTDTRQEKSGFSAVFDLADKDQLAKNIGFSGSVSSLRITRLTVYADGSKKPVEILYAASAKNVNSGHLLLEGCRFLDESLVRQQVATAEMDIKEGLVFSGPHRVCLDRVAAAIRAEAGGVNLSD